MIRFSRGPLNADVRRQTKVIVQSVRHLLLEKFPPPPGAVAPDEQLGHALYSMLWDLGDPDVSVDGWKFFRVTGETDASLDAVGLMWLLPTGLMPIALRVDATNAGLSWKAQASLQDDAWLSLSESKRWNQVYLLAGGDLPDPQWSWNRTYTGFLSQADA